MPDAMHNAIVERVCTLRAGTTMCPGRLARDLGSTLAAVRPILRALAVEGKLSTWQKGRRADLGTLRGPFRVGPP